jgi:hypothetical protein
MIKHECIFFNNLRKKKKFEEIGHEVLPLVFSSIDKDAFSAFENTLLVFVCIQRMNRLPSHKIPNKIVITFINKSTRGTKDHKLIALLTFDIPIYENYER